MVKLTPAMLSSFSINTQFSVHFNSSSISQFIKGKSKDLQKYLKYFNGTASSVFKGGIVFPTIFVLYLNDLRFEALSSTSSTLSL